MYPVGEGFPNNLGLLYKLQEQLKPQIEHAQEELRLMEKPIQVQSERSIDDAPWTRFALPIVQSYGQ